MTQDDKKTVREFMADFWKFFKKYLEFQNSDEFWDEAVGSATALMKKYNNDPIFDETIAGYIAGIDKQWRKTTGRWKE